ncbi:MAG: septal ring lytic transglycosylase RlpA family protein [Bradymonadaceae bacterium]
MSVVKALVLTTMAAHFQTTSASAPPEPEVPPVRQTGVASWYGAGHWHGEITANGEQFDPSEPTCAHRSLPFNTVVLVENTANGRRAWCRINDRGPYALRRRGDGWEPVAAPPQRANGRGIIDLTIAVAERLKMKETGLQRVRLRYWVPARRRDAELAMREP